MKNNWQIKKLGEVCEIVNGGTPDTKIPEYWNGDILWITPKDMGKLKKIHVYETPRRITSEGLKNSSAKILPNNSIILSSRAPIGHLAINEVPMATNQGCKGIIPGTKLDTEFTFYFLKNSVELLNQLGSGTTFKELSGSKLSQVEVPTPPIEEQKRIVEILDKIFADIKKVKEKTEKNLQNSKDLFESYLQNIFSNPGKDWGEKKLGEIYQIGSSKRVLKSQWQTEGVPFYRGREITRLAADGYVDNELFISETHYQELLKQSGVPKPGDIVITAIGTIGNLHIVRGADKFYFKDASVLWMKKVTNVSSEFIKFWLKSPHFFTQLDKDNGATVDTLTIKKLQSATLYLPSLREQQEIVKKLDMLSAETKKLEAIYKQKLADLEELKKSILQKAFSGEL